MMRKYLGKLKEINYSVRIKRLEKELFERKSYQKEAFANSLEEFKSLFNKIEKLADPGFIQKGWQQYNEEFIKEFMPDLRFDFLRHRLFHETMFVNWRNNTIETEYNYLKKSLDGEYINAIIEEEAIGAPHLYNCKWSTSPNSIHHLYHMIQYQNETGSQLDQVKSVIEWGGGYGNFARLFRKLNNGTTYTIIDSPFFTSLQWIYLTTIFGADKVNVITSSSDSIINHKINLVPVNIIKDVKIKAELFVATWSLSESSTFAQEYVIDKTQLFEASKMLLAFQKNSAKFPSAEGLLKIGDRTEVRVLDCAVPSNRYLFK